MKKFLYSLGLLVCLALLFIMYEVTCRVVTGTDDIAIYLVLFGWMVLAAILGANIVGFIQSFVQQEKK